jgi:hypothetical protein
MSSTTREVVMTPPFGEGHRLGPEDDIGLDEHAHAGFYIIEAMAAVYGLLNGFQRFVVANDCNGR